VAISGLSLSVSISVPLVVAASMTDNLGVMSDDSRAVMNLLVGLLAVLGHDVLALLDVGGVHDNIVLLMALLPLVLDGLLVALLVGLAEALEVVVMGLVSIARLSLSLVIAMSVTSVDDLGIMTYYSGAVVDLGVALLALGDELLHALLDVGCVHNGLAHGSGHLALVLLGHLVALLLHMLLAVGA